MNTFSRRTIICLAPVIAAVWVIHWAWFNEPVKLAVDLGSGTIVYEIEPLKKTEEDKEKSKESRDEAAGDPTERARADANLLAKKLKERIDPTECCNPIRPAGGENRVEIILPTGGVTRPGAAGTPE